MPTTDDTMMQQIIRMVQAGWDVKFYSPDHNWTGGIMASADLHRVIRINNPGWQDDIPAAWARLVEAWERQVGDA